MSDEHNTKIPKGAPGCTEEVDTGDINMLASSCTKLHSSKSSESSEPVIPKTETKSLTSNCVDQEDLDKQLFSAIVYKPDNEGTWGGLELIESLIKKGANVNAKDEQGNPLIIAALDIATNSNRRNIIELLLRHGSDPNASSPEGESVLYLAASRNNEQESNNEIYLDILRLLLSYGARMLDHAPEVWFKPFEAVLENGNIDAVRLFISNGLKLEKCNVPFPLHCAARNKYSQVLEFLLIQKYFDIDRKDSDGLTPLHEALYHKNLDNVKTLLAYKAGVDFPNDFGDTPLCTAVQNKDLDCVKILLTFGAHPKVEFLYRKGRTPLCLAVRQNDTECVDILLANGAELGLSGSTFLLGIKNQISSEIMLSFLRHVALLESQLHFVDQGFYTLFASKYQIQSNRYLADCKLELERLQTSIVYGSTTFYEFLTKKLTCSSTRLTDDYVSSVLESNILENMFLIYGEHLKARFSEVRDFLNLRKEASRALDRILPFDVQTFHIVVKRILNRLNAKDLICLTLI